MLPVILRDAAPNLLRNPTAIWRVAHLARRADLTPELEKLKQRRLPIVIIRSNQVNVIPHIALATIRAAVGDHRYIAVPGRHSWPLAGPHQFGEVITNLLPLLANESDVPTSDCA